MYQPAHFKVDDLARIHGLMRAHPFAVLVSAGAGGLVATHLPTVLKSEADGGDGADRGLPAQESPGVIECHLARPNAHWKDLAALGEAGGEALMIFSGPEGYVTPSFYPSKAEHHKVVPTWNYATVHAYGRPMIMHDAEWLRAHVAELSDQREATHVATMAAAVAGHPAAVPWAVSDAPDSFIDVMLRGIVGFRFEITRVEGKWKMSQNREERDRAGVAAGLAARQDGHDRTMADLVAGKV